MSQKSATTAKRSTYRHGDLARALLDAAIDLARAGGPEAVTMREATRRAGVVPNAAYRHYASRNALLQAVRSAALAALAVAIEGQLARLPATHDPAALARASLRAVGTGYVEFACAEPGLFRTAFSVPDQLKGAAVPEKAGKTGLNPFQLLGAALDCFVDAGLLPRQRRLGADYLAWSAVHGLSMLIIDGPLRGLGGNQRKLVLQNLLDMVERGLSEPARSLPNQAPASAENLPPDPGRGTV